MNSTNDYSARVIGYDTLGNNVRVVPAEGRFITPKKRWALRWEREILTEAEARAEKFEEEMDRAPISSRITLAEWGKGRQLRAAGHPGGKASTKLKPKKMIRPAGNHTSLGTLKSERLCSKKTRRPAAAASGFQKANASIPIIHYASGRLREIEFTKPGAS